MNETLMQLRIDELHAEAQRVAAEARLADQARNGRSTTLARIALAFRIGRAGAQEPAAIASATSRTPCSMSDVVTAP